MQILIRTREQIRVCGGNHVARFNRFSANTDNYRNKDMGMDSYSIFCLYSFYQVVGGFIVKEILIYGSICLVIIYIFILMILRAVFYTFVVKSDPLQSLKIVDKPKGLFKIYKKEKQEETNSKWG